MLIVSEQFYSIQGEGKNAGKPAVFLRLSGCNLRCNGFSYRHPDTGEHLGCDTKHVWMQGTKKTSDDIIADWKKAGWLEKLKQGAHLVITGGEPLIQQTAIMDLLDKLDNVFVEIETNATMIFSDALLGRVDQINASPKLENSGETREKAFRKEVLEQLSKSNKTCFKFVIAKQQDVEEVMKNYVSAFRIPSQQVWLMPEGGTREALAAKKPWLIELCKKHMMHYSPRLQVEIWGEVVGV